MMADPSARMLTITTVLLVMILRSGHSHAKKSANSKSIYGKIKWVAAKDFKIKEETPTGLQFEVGGNVIYETYSGRAKHNGAYYCGRYNPRWGNLYIGTEDGKEVLAYKRDTQLLSFPRGTISWVYMLSGDDEPDNLVECGQGDSDHKLKFLCRVVHEKQVAQGSYFMDKKKCIVSFYGVHEYSRFEIAVTNMLALKTQADSDL